MLANSDMVLLGWVRVAFVGSAAVARIVIASPTSPKRVVPYYCEATYRERGSVAINRNRRDTQGPPNLNRPSSVDNRWREGL